MSKKQGGKKMANEIWDPFEDMKSFRKDIEGMFDNFWTKERRLAKNTGLEVKEPSVDIENKKDEIIVTADLPGVDKKDIDVAVEEDRVVLKAEKKEEKEKKKKEYYRQERSYRSFYRTVPLPDEIIPEKAKSKFDNGVLKLTLPKVKKAKKKSKKLSVK
ncbi:Hsp20 family protein [Candidatus Woesearchaeota archaeon]|nr:Hsp20 family protein [Candidatus Woesearchaeota archaeon]